MTDDDIIRMADEHYKGIREPRMSDLQFARLIQAATLEECAKLCDEIRKGIASMRDEALSAGDSTMAAVHNGAAIVIRDLASELRALGAQSRKEG